MVAKKQESGVPEIVQPDWTSVMDWDAAIAAAPEIYHSTHALGDGSRFIENKDDLMEKGEFLILDWREVTDKKTLNEYLNVLAIFREGNVKVRFNDGSTGIARQLREWQDKMEGRKVPLHCVNITRSDYTIPDPRDESKFISATTYYLV